MNFENVIFQVFVLLTILHKFDVVGFGDPAFCTQEFNMNSWYMVSLMKHHGRVHVVKDLNGVPHHGVAYTKIECSQTLCGGNTDRVQWVFHLSICHLCCAAVGGDSVVHTLSSGQYVCYPRTEVAGLMGTHTNTLMRASASASCPVC